MKRYKYIFLLILLGVVLELPAQDLEERSNAGMGIADVITLTLENNYDIKISKNNARTSAIDAVPGNADYLPTVDFSAGYNYASDNTDLAFADPNTPEINADGAVTETINAGITVNYNIYSGGNRKSTFSKLKNESYISDLQLQQNIESSVLNVLSQFLNTVNLYEAFKISEESVDISRNRYERAETNYAFGSLSKLELLNAEVDLRNDSINLVQAQIAYEKSIKDLNNIIGINPDSSYVIDPTFTFEEDLVVDQLVEEAMSNNTAYLIARSSIKSSELDLAINKARFLPSLDFSGGYQYSDITYGASFLSTQTTLGWNAGLTLSYNIFDAGSRRRTKEKTTLQIQNQKVAFAQTENNLKTDLLKAYDDYQSNIALLSLNERNLITSSVNYERSVEAFSTGQITGIELREAQLNLLNSKYSVSLQRIQAKLSEVNLHFYAGTLVN
ncbi:MAG: TolC family protein [Bacteroidota bacterium]